MAGRTSRERGPRTRRRKPVALAEYGRGMPDSGEQPPAGGLPRLDEAAEVFRRLAEDPNATLVERDAEITFISRGPEGGDEGLDRPANAEAALSETEDGKRPS